jgi:hypothetical protein
MVVALFTLNALEMAGRTADVVRRQPDGTWLFVIDDPYGSEHGFH